MGHDPYVLDGQFDVKPGSAKAPAEQVKRPTVWFPLIFTGLTAYAFIHEAAQLERVSDRQSALLAVALIWPFCRCLQWALWSLRSKVSEEDAERLAQRFPPRGRPPR